MTKNGFLSLLKEILLGLETKPRPPVVPQPVLGVPAKPRLPVEDPRKSAAVNQLPLPLAAVPFVPGSNRKKRPRPSERFAIVAHLRDAGQRTLVFVQQEPQVRLTKWNLGGCCSDRALSFPYMLFIICFFRGVFENLYGFFLREPYSGMRTILCHTVLPNAADTGWICVGNDATKDQLMSRTSRLDSLGAKVDEVLNVFWNETHFSDHVIERLTTRGPALHPNLASLAAWETASRLSPNFVNYVQWEFAGTVEGFLRNSMRVR